ncbi:hypothetical protein E4U47_003592 [Claviceps purpurea]|nr:hypothetical protein E4U47_003592 [Claviceps purpurea]
MLDSQISNQAQILPNTRKISIGLGDAFIAPIGLGDAFIAPIGLGDAFIASIGLGDAFIASIGLGDAFIASIGLGDAFIASQDDTTVYYNLRNMVCSLAAALSTKVARKNHYDHYRQCTYMQIWKRV